MLTAEQFRNLFQNKYNRNNWREALTAMLGRIDWYASPTKINLKKNEWNAQGLILGRFETTDGREVGVYEITVDDSVQLDRNRVGLRSLLKKVYEEDVDGAFIIFDQGRKWRFSYVSEIWSYNAETKVREKESTDPKRYTYVFGSASQLYRTPIDRFQKLRPGFIELRDITQAFSVAALNEEFYRDVVEFFYQLTGATVGSGKKKIVHEKVVKLPSVRNDDKKTYQEFAVRLIGRIIFCWFLKFKRSNNGIALLPEELLSSKAVKDTKRYYHEILERLFFQVLNTPMPDRKNNLPAGAEFVPFLNGGLFEAHPEDFYKPDRLGYSLNSNTLQIKDSWFQDFFETLEQYNFTIDENSIEDAEVSIDPEMLGRIFENLLAELDPDSGESARKATGSFYTPREIVDYMVTESLVQYLHGNTGISHQALHDLFSPSTPINWKSAEKDEALKALDEVKILDPACGSGAFPIGALQKLSLALEKLDPDAEWWKGQQIDKISNSLLRRQIKKKLAGATVGYTRKLGLIQNNIYGVDIQPIAAEISKLRCFLTLVVDENIDDKKDNRGIEPLPNLEFKFVTANTLYPLPKDQQADLFGNNTELNSLHALRLDYLQAFGDEKEDIKKKFKALQTQILKDQLKNSGAAQSRAMLLAGWNPFGEEQSPWFDPEWMYGVSQFHIVIGNPPYGGDKIEDELKTGMGLGSKDPYGAFMARFLHKATTPTPLAPGGILAFIVSDTFMTIKTHLPLRQLLMENTMHKMIRVHPDTFKATVNTSIIIARRDSVAENCLLAADLTQVSIHDDHQTFIDLLQKTIAYETPLAKDEESSRTDGILYMQGKIGDGKEAQGWTSESSETYAIYTYPQNLIASNNNLPFFVASPKLFAILKNKDVVSKQVKFLTSSATAKELFINNQVIDGFCLSEIAEIPQGISTGDNKYYVVRLSEGEGYRKVNPQIVLTEKEIKSLADDEKLNGVNPKKFEGRHFIPFDKGADSDSNEGWMPNYWQEVQYFIDWSKKALKRMQTLTIAQRKIEDGEQDKIKEGDDRKLASALRNQEYWFTENISFSPTGQYSPTFRIGIGTVFQNTSSNIAVDGKIKFGLLGLLSSTLAKFLFKQYLNHTVHTQEGDLGNFIVVDCLKRIHPFVKTIIDKQQKNPRYDYANNEQLEIDRIVYNVYGLNDDDILEVENWYARRYPNLIAARRKNATKQKAKEVVRGV